jgi:hypothetical protein
MLPVPHSQLPAHLCGFWVAKVRENPEGGLGVGYGLGTLAKLIQS